MYFYFVFIRHFESLFIILVDLNGLNSRFINAPYPMHFLFSIIIIYLFSPRSYSEKQKNKNKKSARRSVSGPMSSR